MGFQEIWGRIKKETDIKNMKQLADLVGGSQPNVSLKKKANIFPPEWAYIVAEKYGLFTEWIMKGEGPKSLDESRERKAKLISEIENWIFDTEKNHPGTLTWFDMEFKRKFPEFDEWLKKSS